MNETLKPWAIALILAFALTVRLPDDQTPTTDAAAVPDAPALTTQRVYDDMIAHGGYECTTDTECEALWDKAAEIAAHSPRQ